MIMESPKILGMIISDQATGYELIHLLFISSTSNVRMKMCQWLGKSVTGIRHMH